MAAPKLVYANANGQSSVIALFDQPMRKLGPTAPEDPENVTLWTPGGGLPAITSVIRRSDVEFELVLASAAPLAGGYTVTVAGTVESMDTGTPINPAFVSMTFSVTVADLTVVGISWVTPAEFDIVFSSPIATIQYDAYTDVVQVPPIDLTARQCAIIGLSQSGATLRVTLENPLTAGARYAVDLNRDVFVDSSTNVTLFSGQERQMVWGQGQAPVLSALTITEEKLTATCSQTLGKFPDIEGWPKAVGLYNVSQGTLGADLEDGTALSILEAPSASFPLGENVTFSLATINRTVAAGSSWTAQASSVVGAGTEAVGVVTTLNKTAGAPFELLFSGGVDSMGKAGRRLQTTMTITFPLSGTAYPLVAFTLLNTQVSIVIEKTSANQAIAKLYKGATVLSVVSAPWNPSVPFTFEVIDATLDYDGFLAVKVNGSVILGAPAKDLLDQLLIDNAASNTAVAVTLGSPGFPAATFSVAFSAAMNVTTFLGIGLRGFDSKDLFSFSNLSLSTVVSTGANPPLSPGYQGTGKAALGVHAEYLDSVDAIQVIIGLNPDAKPLQFSGSVSLLTGTQQVMDQVLVSENHVLVGGDEIVVVFLHPKQWSGVLVGVVLDIDGNEFTTVVPVIPLGQPSIIANLVQQPARWYHARLSNAADAANLATFGPASIILTPG